MNLKFWSWELKFWILLVLRRSVSHRWFPSPKQISEFHNQNLCENLNRTSFAWTSWFLVKVHIKANSCRIILFEQFLILEWRNRSPKWNLCEKLGKIGTSWNFWLFGQDLCISQIFRTVCTIFEFQMKKQISKSECTRKTEWNRPFLKILTFWSKSKFYLVKAFSFSFSFFLFFFFFFCRRFRLGQVSRSVKPVSGGWRHQWCHNTGGLGGAWRHVSLRLWTLMLPEARGGAWQLLWSWNFWALSI